MLKICCYFYIRRVISREDKPTVVCQSQTGNCRSPYGRLGKRGKSRSCREGLAALQVGKATS